MLEDVWGSRGAVVDIRNSDRYLSPGITDLLGTNWYMLDYTGLNFVLHLQFLINNCRRRKRSFMARKYTLCKNLTSVA